MAQAARKLEHPHEPNVLTPTPDQFAILRDTIDRLEKQSEQAPGGAPPKGSETAPAGRRHSRRRHTMTQTATAAPPAGAKPNALTMAEMLVIASDLGTQTAQGNDAQVKFDLKVAEAAYLGAIDLTKDKHGPGFDDAMKLAETYYKARNSTNIFNHKEGKQRKLGADLRTMVKLGGSPKFGVGEPMATINNLVTLRQNLRKTANKGVKLDDAHNMLMRFARTQLTRDTLIDGEELKRFAFKPDSDPREPKEVIRSILNTAIKLRDGKLANCPAIDSSQEISTIINACNRRLSAIAKAEGEAKGQAA